MSKVGLPPAGFSEMAFGTNFSVAERATLLKLKSILTRELATTYERPESGTLTVTATQSGFNFQVSWTPVPGAVRYQVYRGTTSTFSATTTRLIATIAEQLTPGNRTYTDVSNQYAPATVPTLYYWVRAVDDIDEGPIGSASVANSGVDIVVDDAVIQDLEVNGQITADLVESFDATDLVIATKLDSGTGNRILATWSNGALGGDESLVLETAGGDIVEFERDGIILASGCEFYFDGETANDVRFQKTGNNYLELQVGNATTNADFEVRTLYLDDNSTSGALIRQSSGTDVYVEQGDGTDINFHVFKAFASEVDISLTLWLNNNVKITAATSGVTAFRNDADNADTAITCSDITGSGTVTANISANNGVSGSFMASSDGINLDVTVTVDNGIVTAIV